MSDLESEVSDAIFAGNVGFVRQLLTTNPGLVPGLHYGNSWLCTAVRLPSKTMVETLLSLGCDVNERGGFNRPLEDALATGHYENVQLLLEHGADPLFNHPVVSAVITKGADPCALIKLLESYGADLHVIYDFGPKGVPMNALKLATMYGKKQIADYLRSRGARMPEEYSAAELSAHRFDRVRSPSDLPPRPAPARPSDPTIAYFSKHFGPVDPEPLVDAVLGETHTNVHVIPAAGEHKYVTLFTTGMSTEAMTVPKNEPEAGRFRYAELFLQLPAEWNYEDLDDPKHGWPVHWLQFLAEYPRQTKSWLGGPATIFTLTESMGPNLPFDSFLLFAERHYTASDGRLVQLFRVVPLSGRT